MKIKSMRAELKIFLKNNWISVLVILAIYGGLLGIGPLIEPLLLRHSFYLIGASQYIMPLVLFGILGLAVIILFIVLCFISNVYADAIIYKINNNMRKTYLQRIQKRFFMLLKKIYNDGDMYTRINQGSNVFTNALTLYVRLLSSIMAIILLISTMSSIISWILVMIIIKVSFDMVRAAIEAKIRVSLIERNARLESEHAHITNKLFLHLDYLLISSAYTMHLKKYEHIRVERWQVQGKQVQLNTILDGIDSLIYDGLRASVFINAYVRGGMFERPENLVAQLSAFDNMISSVGMLRGQLASLPSLYVPINRLIEITNKVDEVISHTHQSPDYIELDNVTVTIEGKTIIDSLSLKIKQGEKIAIIGQNGSGKTTLIRIILGLIPYNGKEYYGIDERYEKYTYAPSNAQLFDGTVMSNISHGHIDWPDKDVARISSMFISGLGTHATNIKSLSEGEKQRVSIARALSKSAQVLIADEPTSSLDVANTKILFKELLDWNGTVIIATHDYKYLEKFNRIIVMDKGKVLHDCSWDELISKEEINNWPLTNRGVVSDKKGFI